MERPTLGFRRNAQEQATLAGLPLCDVLDRSGVGTPAYVYDVDAMVMQVRHIRAAFGTQRGFVAYAVKANSAGTILRAMAGAGAGADVVSGGELLLALECDIARERIVMSGVAKTNAELELALSHSIRAIQVESVEELSRIVAAAERLGSRARVSLRINPGVKADTHAHIATGHDAAKFGISLSDLPAAFSFVAEHAKRLKLVGLSTHVGSMLTAPQAYLTAGRHLVTAAQAWHARQSTCLEFCDFGGGFGIAYDEQAVAPPEVYVAGAVELLKEARLDVELLVEPGRSVVGPFGALVATVLGSKESATKRWAMIDAGMNDLLRPALYGARHRIEPLNRPPGGTCFHVVGPVCESSDDFGAHELGSPLPGHVVIRDAGAYGFSMASEYNGRPLPSEIFLTEGQITSVSPRASFQEWAHRRARA